MPSYASKLPGRMILPELIGDYIGLYLGLHYGLYLKRYKSGLFGNGSGLLFSVLKYTLLFFVMLVFGAEMFKGDIN